MDKLPQIVRQRLAALPPGEHPDADVLAAFSERTLAAREREPMLAHLAVCADCREIVALSAASAGSGAAAPWWRAFLAPRALQWAGAAAVVALVAVALSVNRPEERRAEAPTTQVAELKTAPVTKTEPSPATNQPASPSTLQRTPQARVVRPGDVHAFTDKAESAGASAASSDAGVAGGVLRGKEEADAKLKADKQGEASDARSAAGATLADADAARRDGLLAREAKDAVSAQAAAAPAAERARSEDAFTAQRPAGGVAGGRLSASNANMAAESAPSNGTTQKKAMRLAVAKTAGPAWKVENGRLQRLDASRSAYDDVSVSTAARLSVVGSLGTEVWVGGADGSMFYSNDQGAHWIAVSTGAWSKDATFTGITPTALRSVEVSLSNGERWRSADGGASWTKYQ